MEAVDDETRIYASKKLMDEVKQAYPEAAGMTYTGLTEWAFRKLLEAKT